MSLLSTLMSKIFGHAAEAKPTASTPIPIANPLAAATSPSAPAPVSQSVPAAITPVPTTLAPPTPPEPVDVSAILNGLAAKNPEKLDWKRSIVDLMKLVGMESSLSARKELATDLGYTGDKGDSATMNIWLHKQVLKKLAENGGKVPEDLLS